MAQPVPSSSGLQPPDFPSVLAPVAPDADGEHPEEPDLLAARLPPAGDEVEDGPPAPLVDVARLVLPHAIAGVAVEEEAPEEREVPRGRLVAVLHEAEEVEPPRPARVLRGP